MKQVFWSHDVSEAHFVKGLLESQGLSPLVRGEALAGLAGGIPLADACPTLATRSRRRPLLAGGAGTVGRSSSDNLPPVGLADRSALPTHRRHKGLRRVEAPPNDALQLTGQG